jgi:adenine-specific DNA-methyltransferase
MSTQPTHSLFEDLVPMEDERYLTEQLITYIGNKRALLPFIGRALERVKSRVGHRRLTCLDLFSGTGVISRFLKAHAERLVANDLELYSRITNDCFLTNRSRVDFEELQSILLGLRQEIAADMSPGFMTELYAPRDEANIQSDDRVFYTRRNATYIDSARRAIGRLAPEVQKYFLAPLIASASVHTNTAGVFKGFYKSPEGIGQFGGSGRDALTRILRPIELELPRLSCFECSVTVEQRDANELVSALCGEQFDVAYLDPPYNQHPYGSNYFMLNLIATYQRPGEVSRVSGIPVDWNRSAYNRRGDAEDALFDLIDRCPARFVLISYNSEGFISQERFNARLAPLGRVQTLETPYNTFRGSRNLAGRAIHVTEFLYLLEK